MQSLLVLVSLAACIFAQTQDQATAEQYFRSYGYYPSWYNSGLYGSGVVRSVYPGAYYGSNPYGYTHEVKETEKKYFEEKKGDVSVLFYSKFEIRL